MSLEQFLLYFKLSKIGKSLNKFKDAYYINHKLDKNEQIDIDTLDSLEIDSLNTIINIKYLNVKKYIDIIRAIIPDVNKYTKIQPIIIEFNRYITSTKPTECDDKLILLSELVNMSGYLLKYDILLKYTVV
jgi:hypothetical protein